jgi:hypothetical protein
LEHTHLLFPALPLLNSSTVQAQQHTNGYLPAGQSKESRHNIKAGYVWWHDVTSDKAAKQQMHLQTYRQRGIACSNGTTTPSTAVSKVLSNICTKACWQGPLFSSTCAASTRLRSKDSAMLQQLTGKTHVTTGKTHVNITLLHPNMGVHLETPMLIQVQVQWQRDDIQQCFQQ